MSPKTASTKNVKSKPRIQDVQAKRCSTAAGWMLQDDRVLLVKHKMLGIWLAPGGHLEEDELPHQAAVREFFEETGIKSKAISAYPLIPSDETEYLPMPFSYNVHWINHPDALVKKTSPSTGKICEQHYNLCFFVEPIGSIKFAHQIEEVDDIRWFTREEIAAVETLESIKNEALFVFDHYPRKK